MMNIINKRDDLEHDYLRNDKFKDDEIERKIRINGRIRDKSKVKDNNNDLEYELKDKMKPRKHDIDRSKYIKDESKDSKHRNDKLKDKSKDYRYELKNKKKLKYDLNNYSIDHNAKIIRKYKDHKCVSNNNNGKSNKSTQIDDSKIRNDCSKSAKKQSKYGNKETANSTDGNSKKERKYKCGNPEIIPNTKKTIESPFELKMKKEEIITPDREKKRNINCEKKSKSRSDIHTKIIDETCTSNRRKNKLVSYDHPQKNIIRIARKPLEIPRKNISKNSEQTGKSVVNEVYRLNRMFKNIPLIKAANYTGLTNIMGKAEMEIDKGKTFESIMKEKNDEKKDLLNSDKLPYECKEDDKGSLDSISDLDIYKMENMIVYEMDTRKRFLKKLESNRKRTEISMLGNSSLSDDDVHNERKNLLPPEEPCRNGTIAISNSLDYDSKYKTLEGNIRGTVSDLRIEICENEDTIALCKRLTNKILIRSNFNKTCEENIIDDKYPEISQIEKKNENYYGVSLLDAGNIQTNTQRSCNRGTKRVSFAKECGLICHNSDENSTETLVPLKNLKKIMHNLSNNKINKVGQKKKRKFLNKKTWEYSSKLLKLFRNKSITFGKDKHVYQSIKKKPGIGENLDKRIKINNLSPSLKNIFNLDKLLLIEPPKPIKEDEMIKNELEIKETNSASKLSNNLISLEGLRMRMNNMTLRSYNVNSNQLIQTSNLVICSTSKITTKEIEETASIIFKNPNQVNDCRNEFHFPHKDDHLKRFNANTDDGPIKRRNMFPKSNLGNNGNLSCLKFHHQDHIIGSDSSYEVKMGSACKNIKMELTEKDTFYCSQSFLKPDRAFLEEIKRNNFTNNSYSRKNNVECNYLREKDFGKYHLTSNAKYNQLLKPKRLWSRKKFDYNFGKKVNGSSYNAIHSRSMERPDSIRFHKDCSDQIVPNKRRKKDANKLKTLNSSLCEDKLKCNRADDANNNLPKIVIKDSDNSLFEVKFSDNFSINVSGNEIKVYFFGNNDIMKGITLVNNHLKLDNDVKTCPDTKLHTSVEMGTETENQNCHNGKFNHDSKIITESKTFVDKSSWTENDYFLHKVRGNNKYSLTVDKNGNKTESYSGNSWTGMVDVGTDCSLYNTISTSMENEEINGDKCPEIEPNRGSSDQQRNFETSNTQQGRNCTFIEYNMPENNKIKDESMNILKTMKISNNKVEFKKDVGTQYDIGVTFLANQVQKSTSLMQKSLNLLHEEEGVKYIEPTVRIVEENLAATTINKGAINNYIQESLNVTDSDMNTDEFDFSALNISLPEQEIKCEPILLSNLGNCDVLTDSNVSKKRKKSTKVEGSDCNIFTYLVKKIKTLINSVSDKFKLEISSKSNQQSESENILGNTVKIKSSISFTKKKKFTDNFNRSNCDKCGGYANFEKASNKCSNKLIENENIEETNIKKEFQLIKISNLKDFVYDAVEKFLTTNSEFFPNNVRPIQISIKDGKHNFNNSNQLQNINNFKKETIRINPTFTNKNRNNICLESNKRIQNKNNLTFSPSTTMIKRFFCKDKWKNTEVEYEISRFKRVPPQELAVKTIIRENELIIKKWLINVMKSKERSFEIIQDKILHKLNKIAASENTTLLQDAFDTIQKLQFHKHQLSHSGRNTFDQVDTSNFLSDDGHYIMITEQLNVRGFLVSIGLKDDVAWEAQEDHGLNIRLRSAIFEARNWVNKIVMNQGLLMYILAVMLPREIDNYYLQIVEAIINKRISDIGSLLSIVMVLKRYRRGNYHISSIVSKEDITNIVPRQIPDAEKRHAEYRSRFMALYNIAKLAAAKIDKELSQEAAGLLVRLTFSYSPGLRAYMYLLVHYIAQDIIFSKGQLSMAVSYLRSLKTIYFNQLRFEQNCGLARNKVILKGKEKPTDDEEID